MHLLGPFIVAFCVAALCTPVIIWWYKRQGWLDDPKGQSARKVVHTKPVPRGGGIAIFLAILVSTTWFIGTNQYSLGIIAGALILTILGVFDDLRNLNPYLRLICGILASLCVVMAGIGIAYLTNPLGPPGSVIRLDQPQVVVEFLGESRSFWILSNIFAVIWIVWTMNMVNWSKGVDGQMPGFVAIAAVVIALLSLRFRSDITQGQVTDLAMITAGAFTGFLVWNAHPQKIMPGYGGGSLAGYLLAVLSILAGAKVATLMLVLALPLIDGVYTILRRLLRGKSPVWGDNGHFHHRLLALGLSKRQVAYFYWGITAMLGILSLTLTSELKLFSLLTLTLIVGGALLGLKWLLIAQKGKQYD